jgi:universal stress protein A
MTEAMKIVVPTDFSDESLAVLDWVKKLNIAPETEIHCINVVHQPMIYTPLMSGTAMASMPTVGELERISAESLSMFVGKHLNDFGVTPVTKILVGRPAEEITGYAKEIGAQMIVIATRGHSKLAHALLGSTAEGVARQAECPVLTVPS